MDFDDLFYDQSTISTGRTGSQVEVRKVPRAPPSLDDLFLTQAFTTRTDTTPDHVDKHLTTTQRSPGPRAVQVSTPSSQSQRVSQVSQTSQGGRSSRVGIVPPTPATRRPIFSQKTPHRAQGVNTTRNDVTPHTSAFTPRCIDLPRTTPGGSDKGILKLRPVAELPEEYQSIFPFPYFNAVQSKAFDDVLYTDRSVVVSAPTGSGKTALFELAIIRLLMTGAAANCKVVYMAPIKALCAERFEDWQRKLGPLGLQCKELTGDTEMDDYYDLQAVNIILTTPEKWDSMTRRWRDNKSLVQTVRLFLIDEVHMLNDSSRGATMEAVVSRMKTVNSVKHGEDAAEGRIHADHIRFMAVSATIPNAADIGEWLNMDSLSAACHKLDESHRPVRLRKVVLGFPCSDSQSEFRFDLSLNYKLASIIETYSEHKPTLVFCATRKGVQQAAATVVKEARFVMSAQHKARLLQVANSLRDSKLRDTVLHGVGFHHAGMDHQDRKTIEASFTTAELPVLMATSTLAMGVNLPAHLVIIKSTQHYNMGGYEEYSETSLLQMIGRAGRPQFDTSATAVIMTRTSTKRRYENLINGNQLIESSLHQNLVEHLNAEVVLSTITDVSVGLEWIKSTFLYIRIMKNPKHYGLSAGIAKEKVEQNLQELCVRNLNALADVSLIHMDEDNFGMKPTETGRLMARYCIAFETMKRLKAVGVEESINDLLTVLCKSEEFKDIQLRNNEKRTLNTLNKDKNRTTIRFPMEGKIKTNEMKVNCLIQATLGCLPLQDFALSSDMTKISRSALRISKCMVEVLWTRSNYKTLLNAILLGKCIRSKIWENSRHVARQLSGIGDKLANMLVNAGIATFQRLEETNPRELELIVNRHPPFGNQVRDAVCHLPKYELCIDQMANYNEHSCELTVTVSMVNAADVGQKATLPAYHTAVLIMGDSDNKVVFKARVSDAVLTKGGVWSKRFEVRRASKAEELYIHFISQDFVGIDVQSTYVPFYTGPKRVRTSPDMGNAQKKVQGNVQPKVEQKVDLANFPGPTLLPGRRECSHSCGDKMSCAHDCCKHGVPVARSRGPSNTAQSHQEQLRNRASSMPATPNLKRLKPGLGRFAYTPQTTPRLPRIPSEFTPGTSSLPSLLSPSLTGTVTPHLPILVSPSGTMTACPATWQPQPAAMTPGGCDMWDEIELHQQRSNATRRWTHDQGDNDDIIDFEPNEPMFKKQVGLADSRMYPVEDFQSEEDLMRRDPNYLPDPRSCPPRHQPATHVGQPISGTVAGRSLYWNEPSEDTIIIEDEEDDTMFQPFSKRRAVLPTTSAIRPPPLPFTSAPQKCYPSPVFTRQPSFPPRRPVSRDSSLPPAQHNRGSSHILSQKSSANRVSKCMQDQHKPQPLPFTSTLGEKCDSNPVSRDSACLPPAPPRQGSSHILNEKPEANRVSTFMQDQHKPQRLPSAPEKCYPSTDLNQQHSFQPASPSQHRQGISSILNQKPGVSSDSTCWQAQPKPQLQPSKAAPAKKSDSNPDLNRQPRFQSASTAIRNNASFKAQPSQSSSQILKYNLPDFESDDESVATQGLEYFENDERTRNNTTPQTTCSVTEKEKATGIPDREANLPTLRPNQQVIKDNAARRLESRAVSGSGRLMGSHEDFFELPLQPSTAVEMEMPKLKEPNSHSDSSKLAVDTGASRYMEATSATFNLDVDWSDEDICTNNTFENEGKNSTTVADGSHMTAVGVEGSAVYGYNGPLSGFEDQSVKRPFWDSVFTPQAVHRGAPQTRPVVLEEPLDLFAGIF